ncbi:ribonuclease J [Clostridium sp. UBA5119]|uniref:ribonuclease J n=1 Tax=Clostridium sp. UBA5119 TaxID=1946366 RepID=UPI00321774EA
MKSKIKNKIRVISLGGLGEIGKNITAIEYKDEIIVIDCGISFPEPDMYGVDLVIPDVTYLLENKDKVKGFFLTHGHEDHIGALPYVLKQLNVPVYGTRLTLGLVESKLEEHNILKDCDLNVVKAGSTIKLENISVEFIRNSHSIADSCAIAVHTPIGRVIHTGDFKVDYTPIDGEVMDLQRLSTLGKQGVLLLLADSTNVERQGYTISEKVIGESLNRIFGKATGRVIVATFASNIHRLQQIVNASIFYERKIAFSGRSMEKISQVAMNLGYLNIPEESIVGINDIGKYDSENITIITTGSQGEPMSALTRIAAGIHRSVQVEKGDLVIISASPIPGNEKCISNVINDLFKRGAEVIYNSLEEIHVSGHACQEELKLIHSLVKPKYFMPVHGEYRHLMQHGLLAEKLGMDKSNIFVSQVGDVLEVHNKVATISGKVKTGAIMVDGLGVGDVGSSVLHDRKLLAQDGILTVVITIKKDSYTIVAGPDIITRGFVYVRESENIINEARDIVLKEVEKKLASKDMSRRNIKFAVKNSLSQFIYMKIKRRPIIMPIIMEV